MANTKTKAANGKAKVVKKPIDNRVPNKAVRNKIMADALLAPYYAWIEAGRPTRT